MARRLIAGIAGEVANLGRSGPWHCRCQALNALSAWSALRRFCCCPVSFDGLVEEAADFGGGVGADEAGDGVAVAEDGDGGDALDAVLGGEHLLSFDVDLGELELAVSLCGLGFDRGTEHAAGATPGGPEVDNDA